MPARKDQKASSSSTPSSSDAPSSVDIATTSTITNTKAANTDDWEENPVLLALNTRVAEERKAIKRLHNGDSVLMESQFVFKKSIKLSQTSDFIIEQVLTCSAECTEKLRPWFQLVRDVNNVDAFGAKYEVWRNQKKMDSRCLIEWREPCFPPLPPPRMTTEPISPAELGITEEDVRMFGVEVPGGIDPREFQALSQQYLQQLQQQQQQQHNQPTNINGQQQPVSHLTTTNGQQPAMQQPLMQQQVLQQQQHQNRGPFNHNHKVLQQFSSAAGNA